jgi:hypothetical protein
MEQTSPPGQSGRERRRVKPIERILFWLALGAASAAGLGADPVVELPAYVVADSRLLPPPENWRYGAAPGFEFLSNLSAGATQDRIRDFILFHRAVDLVWPLIRINAQAPAAVVYCAGSDRFAEFAPLGAPRDLSGTISIALQNHEQAAIIVNLAAAESEAGAGPALENFANRLIRAEYVHFLFSRIEPAPPPWLAQGLTRLFLKMDYGDGQIRFDASGGGADLPRRKALAARLKAAPARPLASWTDDPEIRRARQEGALIPFAAFFLATPPPGADAESGGTAWDRQCYEFIHLCLFAENGRYRKGLAALALAAMRGPITREGFQSCFQLTYEEMQVALWANTQSAAEVGVKFPAAAGDPAHVALRPATDAEAGRIKGDALRLEHRFSDAHLALIAPYLRGSRDPQLLAALGQEEAAAGKDERARRFLEAAAAGKTTRARAYVELARLRYAAARAAPAGAGGELSPEQWAPVLASLATARGLRPALRETYELLAAGWRECAVKPTREQLAPVIEGVELFPDDLELVYRAAVLLGDCGLTDAARQLAAYGEGRAMEGPDRGRFSALRGTLNPSAPLSSP